MIRLLLMTIVLSTCAAAAPAATRLATRPAATRPSPIEYRHEVRKDPPLHLHIATVNLADTRVTVRVARGGDDPDGEGEWAATLQRTSVVAQREGFELAVNGDYFRARDVLKTGLKDVPYFIGNPGRPVGLAAGGGVVWSRGRAGWWAMRVNERGMVSFGEWIVPPPDTREAVGGLKMLVRDGRVVPDAGTDLAPRTAVGVDRDGRTMIFLVVDGRREKYSAGLTFEQAGREMLRLGAHDALSLDGGGSSTMVMRHPTTGEVEVKNRPSDGHDLRFPLSIERAVCNVVGVAVEQR